MVRLVAIAEPTFVALLPLSTSPSCDIIVGRGYSIPKPPKDAAERRLSMEASCEPDLPKVL
jgi:hypothetical protein